MKRTCILVLAMVMMMTMVLPACAVGSKESQEAPKAEQAIVTAQGIRLDGNEVQLSAYNINDANYVKLRDVSALLKDTEVKFRVEYDEERNEINVFAGEDYDANDADLAKLETGKVAKATPSMQHAFKVEQGKKAEEGSLLSLKGYNVDGFNYFKLRDLGQGMGFGVAYDYKTKEIILSSTEKELEDLNVPKVFVDPIKEYQAKDAGELGLKPDNGKGQPEIAVWGRPTCPACVSLTEYLDEQGYTYTYHNTRDEDEKVAQENRDFLEAQGINAVPFIVIGSYSYSGYNASAVRAMVEANRFIMDKEFTDPTVISSKIKPAGDLAQEKNAEAIVLYGFEACPYCVKIKNYMDAQGIKYVVKDTKEDPAAKAEWKSTGNKYVPTLIVGPFNVEGSSVANLNAAIQAAQHLND